MIKETAILTPNEEILHLKVLAKKRENARRKLAITAKKLAATAVKLAITAKEKEDVRRKLAVTAAKLATTATKLAVTAEEKETVRRKLVVTAAKLATTAEEKEDVRRKLAVTAEEKEDVRRKLVITAQELKNAYETLEKKVFDRTKSLEMARAKEEAILLSIGDGLMATDEKGNVIFINKTAEKILNKKNMEVVGKIFSEVVVLVDDKGIPILLENHPTKMALLNKATPITGVPIYFNLYKDKKIFPVSIIATPVILNDKVIGTIKVFRDVTYEREIDKAKTEFVSLASHQLRTPLSTVSWYAEMLLTEDMGGLNKKQKKYLNAVYFSNKRMVELVNALLDVSSLELGTFVIEPELIDVFKFTEDIINEQKPQMDDIFKKYVKKLTSKFESIAKQILN